MREVLAQTASIAVVVFAVVSMMSVGFAYRLAEIVEPLREFRAVFRALLANFVLVPLLAVGITWWIPLDPAQAVGLYLLAGSAGAPFLIKLASAADDDVALSAALLLLLVPATVVFLPVYVPWATGRPSLQDLSYTPSSVLAIGLPLLSTLILPLLIGLATRAAAPRLAAPLAAIGGKVASVALVVVFVATFGANLPDLLRVVTFSAILDAVLLTLGAYAVGNLISRRERSVVLGLGTAQRNVAGALVIASRDFTNPDVLVMITASVLVGLIVLFPLAWFHRRRRPGVGPPLPERALPTDTDR